MEKMTLSFLHEHYQRVSYDHVTCKTAADAEATAIVNGAGKIVALAENLDHLHVGLSVGNEMVQKLGEQQFTQIEAEAFAKLRRSREPARPVQVNPSPILQ